MINEQPFRDEVVRRLAASDIEPAVCNKCGEPIILQKTHDGKWRSLSMALKPHYNECPDRQNKNKK